MDCCGGEGVDRASVAQEEEGINSVYFCLHLFVQTSYFLQTVGRLKCCTGTLENAVGCSFSCIENLDFLKK